LKISHNLFFSSLFLSEVEQSFHYNMLLGHHRKLPPLTFPLPVLPINDPSIPLPILPSVARKSLPAYECKSVHYHSKLHFPRSIIRVFHYLMQLTLSHPSSLPPI